MIIRDIQDVKTVDWGNGISRRFLLASDGVGYTLTDTVVLAGTKSRLEYRNHLEACYCIAGSGEVIELDGTSHPITPGRMYALDQHDAHYLVASPHEDLRLVCVFSPALHGDETHSLDEHVSSAY
ncbi:ectoine synthase [Streptomyces sp. NPDC096176]|uniref:ectoine synthase n=1 Tax=Streptomyces sp. NPDC096176 TaxID=3366079 RepID=UPI00380BB672